MAHYLIKCPCCSHISSNQTVLFDTASASSEKQFKNGRDRGRGTVLFSDSAAPEQQETGMDDLMTYGQIADYCWKKGLKEPTPHYKLVHVVRGYEKKAEKYTDPELLTGVSFYRESGGPAYTARRRVCPECRRELPAQAGEMPAYNFALIGTSCAGKTVYLTALNRILNKGIRDLPYGAEISCLSASSSYSGLTLKSSELFEQGILPAATQQADSEPLVLQLTFKAHGYSKQCLVSISDMRGEDFVEAGGENLKEREGYFYRSNGYIILVSPLNIREYRMGMDLEENGAETNTAVGQAFMNTVNESLLRRFENGKIPVPAVVALSKTDLLIKDADRLHIDRAEAAVAGEMQYLYTRTYFRDHYESAWKLMEKDEKMRTFLENSFTHPYYTAISSLGTDCVIETDENKNRHITNPAMIHPRRVIDPLMYLLIQVDFLPEFYRMEPDTEEKNNAIMNDWALYQAESQTE